MPNAVVLVIDGLGAKHLGPYGNTWIETPAFNRLASESILLERVYAPFTTHHRLYDSLWSGTNAVGQQTAGLMGTNLVSALNAQQVTTRLLTDEAELLDHPVAGHFSEHAELEAPNGVKLAEEWDETHAAQFYAQAIDAIESMPDDCLLWLHTRGIGNPWDAPYAYRQQFADEDDPEPTGSAQVPTLQLDADCDPDMLHEIQCAFAGQSVLMDQCMGVLYSVIAEQAAASNTLFAVTSPRGFPLGEHLQVGWKDPRLYHELLHVPALLRYPDQRMAMRRFDGVAELGDFTTALWDWFQTSDSFSPPRIERRFSICRGADEVLLRTPNWQLLFPNVRTDEVISRAELYLKPDDQNEVNNVADRCVHVVEAGWEFLQTCLNSPPEAMADLAVPDVLLESPN